MTTVPSRALEKLHYNERARVTSWTQEVFRVLQSELKIASHSKKKESI